MKKRPFRKSLVFQTAIAATGLLLFIQAVFLVGSYQSKRKDYLQLNEHVQSRLEERHGVTIEEALDYEFMKGRLSQFATYNFLFLVLSLLGVGVGLTFLLRKRVAHPLLKLVRFYRDSKKLEEFPTEEVPDNEIRELAETLNSAIQREKEVHTPMEPSIDEAGGKVISMEARRKKTLSGRVLLVDDEEDLRFVLASVLGDFGLKVEEASDVQGALELLQSHDFDLVITDIQLGGESGWDLLRKLRTMLPEVPVLIATGSDVGDPPKDVIPDGFVQKPFSKEHIFKKISGILNKRQVA